MKIEIKKESDYQCTYTLTRNDNSVEVISLETKTYFLHDICHYAVEKTLGYSKGFWGLLASGFSFESLFGKENANTGELRFMEQLVGPVQSVFSGNIRQEDFKAFVEHLNFALPEDMLDACLTEIKAISDFWRSLEKGAQITLQWPL